jgi:hypothetical protein
MGRKMTLEDKNVKKIIKILYIRREKKKKKKGKQSLSTSLKRMGG